MTQANLTDQQKEAMEYYFAAKRIRDKSIEKSKELAKKAVDLEPPFWQIYQQYADILWNSKEIKKADKVMDRAIAKYEDPSNKQGTWIEQVGVLVSKLQLMKECCSSRTEIMQHIIKIEKTIEHNQSTEAKKLENIERQIKEINQVKREVEEISLNQEADDIMTLFSEAQKSGQMDNEGYPVQIISMNWFEQWAKQVGQRLGGIRKMGSRKFDSNFEEIEASGKHPGQITNEELIASDELLQDPDISKEQSNQAVKRGLMEKQDFLIVSKKIWNYLSNIQKGKEIKRNVICFSDEKSATQIEIWLKIVHQYYGEIFKQVNIAVYPTPNGKNQPLKTGKVCLSKKETIRDLKEKMIRILEQENQQKEIKIIRNQTKIWKFLCKELDPLKTLKNMLEDQPDNQPHVVIKGHLLDDLSPIEVKYCNKECQKEARSKHKERCNFVTKEMKRKTNIMKEYKISTRSFSNSSKNGLTGLENLGNTCFLNSAIQCLSNTFELSQYFLQNEFMKHINKRNPLGTGGVLAVYYSELIKDLYMGSERQVAPWNIKKIIQKYATQFVGQQQQDSQEFLSQMLDCLHEDLNQIKVKSIVPEVESLGRQDEQVSEEAWANYQKRNKSIIVDLMGGQQKSTIQCPECKRISITFDPFLSLSLPIPYIKILEISFYFIYLDGSKMPDNLVFSAPQNEKCKVLLEQISKKQSIPINCLELGLAWEQKIIDNPNANWTIKDLHDHEGILFCFESQNSKVLPPLDIEKGQICTISLSFLQFQKVKHVQNRITFPRIFLTSVEQTLADFHILIYTLLRPQLKFQQDAQFPNTESPINMSIVNHKDIIKEHENLFLKKKSLINDFFSNPQQCEYFSENQVEEKLPFSEKQTIKDLIELLQNSNKPAPTERNNRKLSINLIFSPSLNADGMRLNKCHKQQESAGIGNKSKTITVYDCLKMFSNEETLDKENEWYCNVCKRHQQATKKLEIFKCPQILILHLKRFKTTRISSIGTFFYTSGMSKIDVAVEFPFENLDLTNQIIGKSHTSEKQLYELQAISNHQGQMQGGHQTAFCKNNFDKCWYEFDDHSVSRIDVSRIAFDPAYILFYRKVNSGNSVLLINSNS